MNVVGCVLHFARTRAAEPALIEGDRTISFGELAVRVNRTASHLTAQGLRRGDRVGLCLRDTSEHLIALLGLARIGAVSVPLDWRARPNENMRLTDALDLAGILVEPDIPWTDAARLIRLDDDWHREVARADAGGSWPDDWHDPFLISASSGSTGAPKLTLMTHWQYYFAIVGMFELMALTGRHRFLSTLPLYYSGGRNSAMAHLLRGDCVVLYSNLYSPAEYVDVVNRERISVAAVVPTAVRQLLAASADEPLFPNLAALFCTGAPLHADEKRRALRRLTPQFHERYGTAETLAISVLRPHDFADRPDSVGQPHSLAEVAVVDESDRVLPCGATGMLRIRGPGMASPLPGQGGQTQFRDGWYYPGEVACLDAAGYIFLKGRTSDVIIRSGAKIHPAEIEAVLLECPGVLEAAVLGHRGADLEETVIAFVAGPAHLRTGELLAHCRKRLTAHKVPRQFHLLAELPRNTAGKIDKLALAKALDTLP